MKMLKFLIGTSFVYFIFAIIFIMNGIPIEFFQILYVIILGLPLYNKRIADFLNYKRFWD